MAREGARVAAAAGTPRFEVWLDVSWTLLVGGQPYVTYERVVPCASRREAERVSRLRGASGVALVHDTQTGEVWGPVAAHRVGRVGDVGPSM